MSANGVLQHQLSQYSPSTISWISSLETFCKLTPTRIVHSFYILIEFVGMFFFGPIIGKLYDAYGSRYILLLGTFLHIFGLMMASISSKYWHFIICQGIVSASGASFIFYPALGDVSTWFFKRRAFALGIMASGSSMGGVILPIMIERLIPQVGFGRLRFRYFSHSHIDTNKMCNRLGNENYSLLDARHDDNRKSYPQVQTASQGLDPIQTKRLFEAFQGTWLLNVCRRCILVLFRNVSTIQLYCC
jgi:nitrate/nitrite transporter NarK